MPVKSLFVFYLTLRITEGNLGVRFGTTLYIHILESFLIKSRKEFFYSVMEVSMKPVNTISEAGGKALLRLARKTISEKFSKRLTKEVNPDPELDLPELKVKRGTFVTLMINKNLRGCIGSLTASESIIESVRHNAVHAAFDDQRFDPLTERELPLLTVEVSILTDPELLAFKDADDLLNKLRPGKDGVILRKSGRSATFLPQVWEQLPEKKVFLSHLCTKAGLPKNAWQEPGLEILVYQVQYFEEE